MSVPVWRRPAEISCLLAGSSECSRRTRARRAPADTGRTRTAESRTSRHTDPLVLRDAYIHLQHHLTSAPPPQTSASLEICCRRTLTCHEDSAQHHLTPLRTHFSSIDLHEFTSTQQKMIFFHKHKGMRVKGHHSCWFVLWIDLNIRGLILLFCCNEDFIFTYPYND